MLAAGHGYKSDICFERDAIVGYMRNSVVTSWIKMVTSPCKLRKALLARKYFEAILRAPVSHKA
jgi:hypothetical protein